MRVSTVRPFLTLPRVHRGFEMTTYALSATALPDVAEDPSVALRALCASVFARPFLRMPQIETLRAYDLQHASGYLATLRACLDSLGNAAASADLLGVHVNTFRYRLRRLVQVAELDLDDADTRLVCALELAMDARPVPYPTESDASAPQWRGLPPSAPVAVVAFRVLSDDENAPCRLARMVAMSWDAFRTSAWCDVTGHTVYSVVTLGASSTYEVAATTVRRVVREAESALGLRVVAGIGPLVDGPAQAEASRRIADDVLRAVVRRGGDHVATLDEVRTSVVLSAFASAGAEWPDLDGGIVRRLADHDATRGTDYVDSLRAYLDCFGDVTDASARAYVHVRTFRYRLRRIAEIGGFRLDDPAARLSAHLALRLR